MPDLQVPDSPTRVQHDGASEVATYAFPFPILDASDVAVFVNDTPALPSAFTVSGVRETNGGSVTFTTPPEDGQKITILRRRPYARMTNFAEAGQFRSRTVNDEYNSQEMQTQQVAEEVGRALRISPTADGTVDTVLPSAVSRRALVFNTPADALEVTAFDPDATVALAASAEAAAQDARDQASAAAAAALLAGVVSTREWEFTLVAGQQVYGPLPVSAAREEALDLLIGGVRQFGIFELEDSIYGPGLGIRLLPTVSNTPTDGELQAGILMAGNVKGGITEGSIASATVALRHMADGPASRTLVTDALGRPFWGFAVSSSAKALGAAGDGVANDTAVIQAMIDSANSSGGGVIVLDPGIFSVSSLIARPGVTLQGASSFSTVLRSRSATVDLLTMQVSSAVKGIKLMAGPARTSGFYINITANGCEVSDCEFDGYYIAIGVGSFPGTLTVDPRVLDCKFRNPVVAAGAGGVQFLNFASAHFLRNVMAGPVAGTQPDFGVRFRHGDTAFCRGNNITLHGKALYIDTPAGQGCYATKISDNFFDSAGTISGGTQVSSAEIAPTGGGVFDTTFAGNWCGLSAGRSGLFAGPSGGGIVDGLTVAGGTFAGNGESGGTFSGAAVRNAVVQGITAAGNGYAGLRFSQCSDFIAQGNIAGHVAGRGNNTIGIAVDAGPSDGYVITGNKLRGNVSLGLFDGGTGVNKVVAPNVV